MFKHIAMTTVAALSLTATAHAATTYTSEAAFLAASGGGLSFESFENPSEVTGTSVTFAAGTFTCSPSQYCPGFFGVRGGATDGVQSVYFATPSSATFTFSTAITHFGIDVIGAGTAGATDITINYVNGSSVLYTNYSAGGVLFAGVIDTIPFLSVTFSGTAPDDGIDFDRLQFKAAVPEPATWALMIAGFGMVGFAMRRRTAASVTA
jgi:hypothetical protein